MPESAYCFVGLLIQRETAPAIQPVAIGTSELPIFTFKVTIGNSEVAKNDLAVCSKVDQLQVKENCYTSKNAIFGGILEHV